MSRIIVLALALGWWLDHRASELRAAENQKTVAKACYDSQIWERRYKMQLRLNEGELPGVAEAKVEGVIR